MIPLNDHPRHELPEGVLPCDRTLPDGMVVYSLTGHTLQEMERYKWIRSEQCGHNVGDEVHQEWLSRFWPGWIRSLMLEHLFGRRCWSAFDRGHFGLFRRKTVEHHVAEDVLSEVAAILQDGGENLDVINWAGETGQDLDAVLWLLDRIDINAIRHRLLTDHIQLFLKRANCEGRPHG